MPIKDKVSVNEVIALLNELNAMDPELMSQFCMTRFECNDKVADHPTVQVAGWEEGAPKMGMIGFLNGLFGADSDGWGIISMDCEQDLSATEGSLPKINHFRTVTRADKPASD